jgi:hypothetical protein
MPNTTAHTGPRRREYGELFNVGVGTYLVLACDHSRRMYYLEDCMTGQRGLWAWSVVDKMRGE